MTLILSDQWHFFTAPPALHSISHRCFPRVPWRWCCLPARPVLCRHVTISGHLTSTRWHRRCTSLTWGVPPTSWSTGTLECRGQMNGSCSTRSTKHPSLEGQSNLALTYLKTCHRSKSRLSVFRCQLNLWCHWPHLISNCHCLIWLLSFILLDTDLTAVIFCHSFYLTFFRKSKIIVMDSNGRWFMSDNCERLHLVRWSCVKGAKEHNLTFHSVRPSTATSWRFDLISGFCGFCTVLLILFYLCCWFCGFCGFLSDAWTQVMASHSKGVVRLVKPWYAKVEIEKPRPLQWLEDGEEQLQLAIEDGPTLEGWTWTTYPDGSEEY